MSASAAISIERIPSGIAVAGDVDAGSAPTLATAIDRAADIADLVVDVAGVDFMDSSGLRVLLADHQRRLEVQHTIRLLQPTAAVRRLLDIAGVADHLLAAGEREEPHIG